MHMVVCPLTLTGRLANQFIMVCFVRQKECHTKNFSDLFINWVVMGQEIVEVNISKVMFKICIGNVVCAVIRFLLHVQIAQCCCALITAK